MDKQHVNEESALDHDEASLFAFELTGKHRSDMVLLLALASKHLSSVEGPLQTVLDTLVLTHEHYLSTKQRLHETSKQLVEAETQLQACIDNYEKFLVHFGKDIDTSSLVSASCLTHLLYGESHQEPTSHTLSTPISSQANTHSLLEKPQTLPALYFTCFSRFEVKRLGQTLTLCTNRSGQTILRYLVAQQRHRASVDKLIGVLWPDCDSEVARRRLQVAISEVRCSLNNGYRVDPGGGYILFKDSVYQLNPAIAFRSDVDEFLEFYHAGRQAKANSNIPLYEQACQFYTGDFLVEDIYADWSFARREQLSQIYQRMCSTLADYYLHIGEYERVVKWTSKILAENGCDEVAHRQLIEAYLAQGRRGEALRQFQRCEQILHSELGVTPMPETLFLYHSILAEQPLVETSTASLERKLSAD